MSVHFPKAGGSSLRVQLERMLGERFLQDYEHHPLGPRAADIVDQLPPNFKMVHGHFRPSRYSRVKNRFLFTFLRNPIENLISIYFFWREFPLSNNPWHVKFLNERPSILEFARFEPLQRLMSESFFGGFDMDSFDFVGFHEKRQVDYLKLRNLIGFPVSGEIHANRTACDPEERATITNSRKTIGKLADLLADDLRFYDRSLARWNT